MRCHGKLNAIPRSSKGLVVSVLVAIGLLGLFSGVDVCDSADAAAANHADGGEAADSGRAPDPAASSEKEKAGRGSDDEVRFRWAFGAVVGMEEGRKFEAITKDTALKTGDRLKMLVEVQSRCFVYVIHHNALDGVQMLFPYSLQQFSGEFEVGQRYNIPEGDVWLELDASPGRETFHLLASAKRLTGLEELIASHESAEAPARPEIAVRILEEIRDLKRRNRDLAAPAERPVAIGGAIRGLDKSRMSGRPDLTVIAREIATAGFHARSFTIDHQ